MVLNRRGDWEIALSNRRDRVTCETLDEARRVAYLWAAHRHPCELVVFDADHRLLHREFIGPACTSWRLTRWRWSPCPGQAARTRISHLLSRERADCRRHPTQALVAGVP